MSIQTKLPRGTIGEIFSQLFTYSLTFYLILYLFELVFPGFVTNSFSLNWVLVATLILGVITVIFPKQEADDHEQKKATRWDFALLIFLSLLSFALIYLKFETDNSLLKLAVSVIPSFLSFLIGIMILYMPEAGILSDSDDISQTSLAEHKLNWRQVANKLFLSKIQVPSSFALAFLLLLSILTPKNFAGLVASFKQRPAPEACENKCEDRIVTDMNTAPTVRPLPTPDPKLVINVYNAGAEAGEAGRIATVIKNYGYENVSASNYEDQNVQNVLILFREDELGQADVVENILSNEFSIINRQPLATNSAEIRVLLGAQPTPTPEFSEFENENFDFFFE